MKVHFISYATGKFKRRQWLCSHEALKAGKVDTCTHYGPEDLDAAFARTNKALLNCSRGAGYWVWKPRIILDALSKCGPDDVVIYCDARSKIIGDLRPIARQAKASEHGTRCFYVGDGLLERQWTKRDTFVLMNCDEPRFHDSKQFRSGTIAVANTTAAKNFIRRWLELNQQWRLVTDLPSTCGKPELEGFREHRHDQSLFSLLCKKHGITPQETSAETTLSNLVISHVTGKTLPFATWSAKSNPRLKHNNSACKPLE